MFKELFKMVGPFIFIWFIGVIFSLSITGTILYILIKFAMKM